ncbi:MAG TPA: hypothetical protein VIJ62_08950 [Rhizomicrobium sp.]
MSGTGTPEEGLQAVEVLHIDTMDSYKFFVRLGVNSAEKCDCQKLLENIFSECVQKYGGWVATNWQGDGGHAFFPARLQSGNSVKAAKEFISKLPILARQTTAIVGHQGSEPGISTRRFRVKAHFANVYLAGGDSRFDAAPAAEFDAFIKFEKQLAPVPDELFITDQLKDQLGSSAKQQFKEYRKKQAYGALQTAVHHLTAQPIEHARKILDVQRPQDLTDSEWHYLRTQIAAQKLNVAARNSITAGLIDFVSDPKNNGQITHDIVRRLTLTALYDYLRVVYPLHEFHLTVWNSIEIDGQIYLSNVASYPDSAVTHERRVKANDMRYQVVRTFQTCNPSVTKCVSEARIDGSWIDFDDAQADHSRGLNSALEIPIYMRVNRTGKKEPLGVLSLDSDKPDLFVREELDLLTDDLIGFLANLALAEHIRITPLGKLADP